MQGREPDQSNRAGGKKGMDHKLTRLELLTVLLSLKALLETGNTEKALELINDVIKEAKHNKPPSTD